MPIRKYRRDSSEISCCLKYIIFSVNVLFWLFGLLILGVGIWAWKEKDTFSNFSKLTNIALDPAFVLIVLGLISFVIGLTGALGALRENTCLLSAYSLFLAAILLFEMGIGVLAFVLKDKGWIKEQATTGLRTFISSYREDPDQQNFIDWIQEDWLQCCGIDGPADWDGNNYFNCSSSAVGSREACGVPFSCCKLRPNEIIKNKQCGYDVRKGNYQSQDKQIFERGCLRAGEDWLESHIVSVAAFFVIIMVSKSEDVSNVINEKGCIQAGEEWMEQNLIVIASIAILFPFLQILGICFAQNLRADIFAQKAKWHT